MKYAKIAITVIALIALVSLGIAAKFDDPWMNQPTAKDNRVHSIDGAYRHYTALDESEISMNVNLMGINTSYLGSITSLLPVDETLKTTDTRYKKFVLVDENGNVYKLPSVFQP